MQRSWTIEIEEGVFGGRFGPNFNILTGGGGAPFGFLLYLFSRRKKKKMSLARIIQLLKTMDTLSILRLIDQYG